MLLQISNADSLENAYSSAGQSDNSIILFVLGFLVFAVLIYIIFFQKPGESNKLEGAETPSIKEQIPFNSSNIKKPKAPITQEKSPKAQNILPPTIRSVPVVEATTNTLGVAKAKAPILQKELITEEKKGKPELEIEQPIQKLKTVEEKIDNLVITPAYNPKLETVIPEKEEQSKEKYIGYNPINIFAQTEPCNFPVVIMPKANCVIKFPRKGRVGRKGYKEGDFKIFIDKYLRGNFQIFDDRFILVKNSNKPYEPDFTLIDEKDGLNLFLDIEIDEPYEGLNDLSSRKATHFQFSDTNRNNAFKNRGWIVIRFAEIQVHQEPISCCRFIADVIKSINPKFNIPDALITAKQINPIKQWTQEEAEIWSREKYRERYLGISGFGTIAEKVRLEGLAETELGNKIELQIKEDLVFTPPTTTKKITDNPKLELIKSAINTSKFLSLTYQGLSTITKPIKATDTELKAFCYIKNKELTFNINSISNLLQKNNYYTLRIAGPTVGIDKITTAVNTAINYKKHIRMKYTRSSWQSMFVDPDTGELVIDRVDAEESVRTINDIKLSLDSLELDQIRAYNLNNNHITAYCNKREEQRTFRFDRIGEIEILDI